MSKMKRNQCLRQHIACLPKMTAVVFSLLASGALKVSADERIVLAPTMILNETATGDAGGLVDEQASIGDVAAGKGLRPAHPFFSGWGKERYPVHVLIDLGRACRVTRLYLYNETGENRLVVSTGKPFAWTAKDIVLGGYQNWREFGLDVTTRYVRLTLAQPTSLPEMALYGDAAPLPAVPVSARLAPPVRPVMDQFIGTNAFIDDPIDKLAASVGFVREYHNWAWDVEGADKQVRFQPSGAGGGKSWFFDDYYARLKAQGVTVCPAIQQNAPVLFGGSDMDAKPVAAGHDAEDPASYALHAAHLFQYAARYGSVPVANTSLRLAPDQAKRNGLGSLHYIENWNEPDKTWKGREGRFTPYELAALCSADCDGDQKRMGATVGVRNADPKMQLVIGGLAGLNLEYLKAMKVWADARRGGDFPADVINLHHYSSTGDEQGFQAGGAGISPEADHLREKMARIAAWRDANLPKCELWVTEFGYDTNAGSPLHSPPIGAYTALEVQGIWLLRSYLALAAAGVNRAAMFMFRDVKSDAGDVFATCGMVTEKGQWQPKPSYFYIATLKKTLAGMRYDREINSGKKDVLVYRFAGAGGKSAYVVWCATSADQRIADVTLPVAGKTATRVDFTNDSVTGKASPLVVRQGQVKINSQERPIVVLVP